MFPVPASVVPPARWTSRGHLSVARQRRAAAGVMLVLSIAAGLLAGLRS